MVPLTEQLTFESHLASSRPNAIELLITFFKSIFPTWWPDHPFNLCGITVGLYLRDRFQRALLVIDLVSSKMWLPCGPTWFWIGRGPVTSNSYCGSQILSYTAAPRRQSQSKDIIDVAWKETKERGRFFWGWEWRCASIVLKGNMNFQSNSLNRHSRESCI